MGLPDLPGKLTVSHRLEELGGITDEPPGLTRTFLSPAHLRAQRVVAGWMKEAGLDVFEDAVGNIIGRRDCGTEDAPTVACGSHLDTVRNAGKYDGAAGILAGIAAAERLRGERLPFHLEVVAFSDEEGVRFHTTYLGSRHYRGDTFLADVRDSNGVSLAAAVAAHCPRFPSPPARRLAAWVELHIEQGPILENENRALGVVPAIAGQTRLRVDMRGKSGHAGTTPMALRRDALVGAAEAVLAVEKCGRATHGAVATVGCVDVANAASNVVPGEVAFTVDVRHESDAIRTRLVGEIVERIQAVAGARNLFATIQTALEAPAVSCDVDIAATLSEIIAEEEELCPQIVSGAGHDAAALAAVARVGMVFVRCREGLSHHPDEFASADDIEAGIRVLTRFLREFRP
ncbi:MAG: M20 family metallo-hydrolase [Terrimicrobiaceae bacterium]|nr:M20 family metallo-hydrolase [Terrimicrobiaceae bacterium]